MGKSLIAKTNIRTFMNNATVSSRVSLRMALQGCLILRPSSFFPLLSQVYNIFKFSDELITLQYYIFMVLLFNFIEVALCFANYLTANETGERVNAGDLWYVSETARVIADTVCRTTLLLLCLGLGIITERISTETWSGVNIFSGTYLMLKLVDHLHVGATVVPVFLLTNMVRSCAMVDFVFL